MEIDPIGEMENHRGFLQSHIDWSEIFPRSTKTQWKEYFVIPLNCRGLIEQSVGERYIHFLQNTQYSNPLVKNILKIGMSPGAPHNNCNFREIFPYQ